MFLNKPGNIFEWEHRTLLTADTHYIVLISSREKVGPTVHHVVISVYRVKRERKWKKYRFETISFPRYSFQSHEKHVLRRVNNTPKSISITCYLTTSSNPSNAKNKANITWGWTACKELTRWTGWSCRLTLCRREEQSICNLFLTREILPAGLAQLRSAFRRSDSQMSSSSPHA